MKYHAVIFDLDGTLLNTLEDLADSTNFALAANGFPRRTLEDIRRFVGNGVAKLIERSVPDGTDSERTALCLADFKAHYLTNMQHKTGPYPGVPALLQELRDRGYHIAVVSNKFDDAVKRLCRDYFGDLLPVAIGETEGLRKKPAPDLVLKCLEALGAKPDGAVYIGDSEVDIQTASNAALPCLSVSWGFRDRAFLNAHGASVIVDTPEELLSALLNG